MIRTEEKPQASPLAAGHAADPIALQSERTESDHAEIVATAMLELAAQGFTVTLDSLDAKIETLTRDEIAIVAERATAIAKIRLRELGRRLS